MFRNRPTQIGQLVFNKGAISVEGEMQCFHQIELEQLDILMEKGKNFDLDLTYMGKLTLK